MFFKNNSSHQIFTIFLDKSPYFSIGFCHVTKNVMESFLKLFSYPVCSQIWLNYTLDDCQFNYITNMKKINAGSASPVVTKEVPKLRGSQLSIKLKLKIAITSFFSTVMSLHLGSPRLHMRSPVPGGSGKFCMVMRSPNTLGNFSQVITW